MRNRERNVEKCVGRFSPLVMRARTPSSRRAARGTVVGPIRSLALLGSAGLISACTGFVHVQAAAPEPVVTATVTADAPAPPPADGQATADVTVDAAPEVTDGDPEEVTATTEPPDAVYEEQPDSPDPTYIWVGGYWGWTGADWGWYPGRWMGAPEGRIYIEPYYERVGGNVVYVRGYWGTHERVRRSYGGDRIVFGRPVRPANYRRGEPVRIERRAGLRPGSRPGGAYAHATGTLRPLPHETAPRRVAAHETGVSRREDVAGGGGATHGAATHDGSRAGHDEHEPAGHETPAVRRDPVEHDAAGRPQPTSHASPKPQGPSPHGAPPPARKKPKSP